MKRLGLLASIAMLGLAPASAAQDAKPKPKLPNIVWITSEDHGPHLGCYGDPVARTPHLDGLAKIGMRYRRAWSNAPVCAPARTAIISGMYPTSTGSEHMRSETRLPQAFLMYPQLLRALGYYCTNRVKEDYNLTKHGKVWDDSSNKAHWRNRPGGPSPPTPLPKGARGAAGKSPLAPLGRGVGGEGPPFFAVFNSTKSHESQIRGHKKPPLTDLAKVRVPAYHPDTPEVRSDWAHYYDNLTKVDADAGEILRELEEAGLLENTIIFYFADHGPGMPRSKRTPLNSGLQVPFIVWFPEAWRHLAPPDYRPGGVSERLISFVDLAPTLLSLAGQPAPAWMQGRAFAGKHIQPAPQYLHGFRGRMDERYDLQRSITDGRYVYLRNYLPHLPAGQHVEYMFVTPTTQVWKKQFELGKLNEAQRLFWTAPRPAHELYDLETDPDEVKNLADAPAHRETLKRLRAASLDHIRTIRDVGFLPEDEIHRRAAGRTPYEMARDPERYPLERVLATAAAASARPAKTDADFNLRILRGGMKDADSAVRYWAALGLATREGTPESLALLRPALRDHSPSARVVAGEGLVLTGTKEDAAAGLETLINLAGPSAKNSVYVRLAALNALDRLGEAARPGLAQLKSWPGDVPKNDRSAYGIPRLLAKIVKQLEP